MKPSKNSRARSGGRNGSAKASVGSRGTFDSVGQAASALGIPRASLVAAKNAGCPAFRNTKVHGDELVAWLEANPLPDVAEGIAADPGTAKLQKLNEEVRKLRLANDLKAGLLVQRSTVAAAHAAMASEWNTTRCRLESEWPVKLVGIDDVNAARAQVRAMMTEVGKVLRGIGHHLAETPTTP